MVIVRLAGGLGNQMFQYAFAYRIAREKNAELKVDLSLLGDNPSVKHAVVRHFDLDVFLDDPQFATKREIVKFNGHENPNFIQKLTYKLRRELGTEKLFVQNGHKFDLGWLKKTGKEICIVGRFQSEEYFRDFADEVKEIYSFNQFEPNTYSKEVKDRMINSESVAIHVRRGDYISHPVYSKTLGGLAVNYYYDAIQRVSQEAEGYLKYFIFSDDIEWCRTNLKIENAEFINQERSKVGYLSDLWLLTQAKHTVISNSTFSWWGAWLGESNEGLIVAPKNWARDKKHVPPGVVPDRWIQLNNSFEKIIEN